VQQKIILFVKKMKQKNNYLSTLFFTHFITHLFTMRSTLPSFRYPKYWEKLQRVSYDLRKQCGLPDTRVDCVANSLAFIGAMDRDSAEEFAKTLNSRGYGVNSREIADYMTGYGYERMPHYVQHITPETNIEQVYSSLQEGYGTLISLNRNSSIGHMATVIRFGGQLAVYDPQKEMLSYNVKEWLNRESAASVDLIMRVNKVSHMLEDSVISVRKPPNNDTKRIRITPPPRKIRLTIRPTTTEYIRKKEKSFAQFVHSVQEAGFDYNQLARL